MKLYFLFSLLLVFHMKHYIYTQVIIFLLIESIVSHETFFNFPYHLSYETIINMTGGFLTYLFHVEQYKLWITLWICGYLLSFIVSRETKNILYQICFTWNNFYNTFTLKCFTWNIFLDYFVALQETNFQVLKKC